MRLTSRKFGIENFQNWDGNNRYHDNSEMLKIFHRKSFLLILIH